MRASRVLAIRATSRLLVGGQGFSTAGTNSDDVEFANVLPVSDRGIKSSSMFPEPNVALYDAGPLTWTYFEPLKVAGIEKLPAPEAKYYQRLTKRPWDVSSSEWVEITYRKKAIGTFYYFTLICLVYFYLPKEKQFSGLKGSDGFYVLLPKNQTELFA